MIKYDPYFNCSDRYFISTKRLAKSMSQPSIFQVLFVYLTYPLSSVTYSFNGLSVKDNRNANDFLFEKRVGYSAFHKLGSALQHVSRSRSSFWGLHPSMCFLYIGNFHPFYIERCSMCTGLPKPVEHVYSFLFWLF